VVLDGFFFRIRKAGGLERHRIGKLHADVFFFYAVTLHKQSAKALYVTRHLWLRKNTFEAWVGWTL
jgi:hypothetical protein